MRKQGRIWGLWGPAPGLLKGRKKKKKKERERKRERKGNERKKKKERWTREIKYRKIGERPKESGHPPIH